MTLNEAAERFGVTPDNLRGRIAAGKLKAKKVGPVWTITEAEAARYEREQLGKRGRAAGRR